MDRILFVDDDERLLMGVRRNLRKEFEVHTALSGAEGLNKIDSDGPFAVIVSDMQMPRMNGIEFLVRTNSKAPDSIRVMLTGNADQQTAVDAINTGDVHQFLTKPCETEEMIRALRGAANEYRAQKIEKDMLERTFQSCVDVLVETMSLANPAAFGRSARLADLSTQIAAGMGSKEVWAVRSAALLSQLGCLNMPAQVVAAIAKGQKVDAGAWQDYVARASQGADLIDKIPRLEEVADAVRYQYKNYDGTGYPADSLSREDIPHLARLLRVVLELDDQVSRGRTTAEAVAHVRRHEHLFDPEVVAGLDALSPAEDGDARVVEVAHLTANMVLADDVIGHNGVLLVCRGWETSESVIRHLQRAADNGLIEPRVRVQVRS